MHRQDIRILYKAILRLHRTLPRELKELGDVYVKDEFRRNQNAATAKQMSLFMHEWTDYYRTLARQVGSVPGEKSREALGRPLSTDKLEDFEVQQVYQLYELKLATTPNLKSGE